MSLTGGEWLAWGLVLGFACLSGLGVVWLTRRLSSRFLAWQLRCLCFALLLIPAPVPSFSEHWAPAIVVLLFESVFQTSGRPGQSFRLLLAGLVLATAIAALIALLSRLRRR